MLSYVKDSAVTLDEALSIAGSGKYTNYVMFVTGFMQFSGICGTQVMAIILPVAGCQLGLSPFSKGLLTSSAFSGLVFSSIVFGYLADMYGRRKVMIYCAYVNVILSLLASLSPESISLTTVWCINGFILGGVFAPAFVFVTEFCPASSRAKSVLLPTCMASLAFVYLPALAWFVLPLDLTLPIMGGITIASWRLFLALVAVPTTISATLLYFVPDSPKFTLNSGDHEGTMKILRSMYAVNNNKSKADFPIARVCLDSNDVTQTGKSTEGGNVIINAFRNAAQQFGTVFSRTFIFYTLISCFMMTVTVGLYNTLNLWFPEQIRVLMNYHNTVGGPDATFCEVMGGPTAQAHEEGCNFDSDIYVISSCSAVLQSFLLSVISFIADRIGKKLFVVLVGSVSLASMICLQFSTDYILTVVSYSVTVVILGVLFPVCFSIIVDFFPTSIRASATSIAMIFGRIGASLGSQVYGALLQNYCTHAYWGMITLVLALLVQCAFSPTKRVVKQET